MRNKQHRKEMSRYSMRDRLENVFTLCGQTLSLTAEYIMNLRELPCSTALEKFLRMAFSRTPGKLTQCQQCKCNFPRYQHNPFDLVEHLVLAHNHLCH